MTITARQIRGARAALGLKLFELAASVPCSPTTISKIENEAKAYDTTLVRIRDALARHGARFRHSLGISWVGFPDTPGAETTITRNHPKLLRYVVAGAAYIGTLLQDSNRIPTTRGIELYCFELAVAEQVLVNALPHAEAGVGDCDAMRFARVTMGLTPERLAWHIGASPEQVLAWESWDSSGPHATVTELNSVLELVRSRRLSLRERCPDVVVGDPVCVEVEES